MRRVRCVLQATERSRASSHRFLILIGPKLGFQYSANHRIGIFFRVLFAYTGKHKQPLADRRHKLSVDGDRGGLDSLKYRCARHQSGLFYFAGISHRLRTLHIAMRQIIVIKKMVVAVQRWGSLRGFMELLVNIGLIAASG